jgi:hypothetical protein
MKPMDPTMLLNDMRKVEHSAEINLGELEFDFEIKEAARILNDLVSKSATKAVADLLHEHPPHLTLPAALGRSDGIGGPPVSDPAMLHLHLPFDENRDSECTWRISLADVIAYSLFDTEGDWNDPDREEIKPLALELAARLRELAGWLENGPPEAELQRWRAA